MRQDERRAIRRAATVAVGFTAVTTAVTLAGILLASWLGGGDARAQVAAAYSSPADLPVCGTVEGLAAPDGVTGRVAGTAVPGQYVQVTLAAAAGAPAPQPLTVVVARGSDVVGEFRGTAPADPTAVVLAGCSADPAADTDPSVPGGRPLLPPGEYEVVAVFGDAMPPGEFRAYTPPDFTALRLPVTVEPSG